MCVIYWVSLATFACLLEQSRNSHCLKKPKKPTKQATKKTPGNLFKFCLRLPWTHRLGGPCSYVPVKGKGMDRRHRAGLCWHCCSMWIWAGALTPSVLQAGTAHCSCSTLAVGELLSIFLRDLGTCLQHHVDLLELLVPAGAKREAQSNSLCMWWKAAHPCYLLGSSRGVSEKGAVISESSSKGLWKTASLLCLCCNKHQPRARGTHG